MSMIAFLSPSIEGSTWVTKLVTGILSTPKFPVGAVAVFGLFCREKEGRQDGWLYACPWANTSIFCLGRKMIIFYNRPRSLPDRSDVFMGVTS